MIPNLIGFVNRLLTEIKDHAKNFPNAPRIRSTIMFIFHMQCFDTMTNMVDPDRSDFIWDFEKLPFLADLGKYIIKNGKISTKIHEIGKIKTIFGLGMTPI